jgi:hypothetical protein
LERFKDKEMFVGGTLGIPLKDEDLEVVVKNNINDKNGVSMNDIKNNLKNTEKAVLSASELTA